jgi:hypothetical protein
MSVAPTSSPRYRYFTTTFLGCLFQIPFPFQHLQHPFQPFSEGGEENEKKEGGRGGGGEEVGD